MPTATTVPPVQAATSAAGLETGTGKAGTHAVKPGTTSAPGLTASLAHHQFKVRVAEPTKKTAKPTAKPTKRSRPEQGVGTVPILQNGKIVHKDVTTRTAALQFISQLSTEPHTTKIEHPDLWNQIVTGVKGMFTGKGFHPSTVKTVTLPYTIAGEKGLKGQFTITETLHKLINTVARKALKDPKFTISTSTTTETQWNKIAAVAGAKAEEREQIAKETTAAAKPRTAGTTMTGSLTGQKLYQSFINTYDSDGKKKTPATGKTVGSRTYWDSQFVSAGLTSTYTISRSEAETAFKTLLAKAAAGTKTVTAILQTHVKAHAATLAAAQAVVGKTGKTGQALSDYFVTEFTTLAHTYLVPISDATINQRAALAAQAGTGYESKENEVADFRATMQKQASSLYPTFATQINKGVTTQTLLNPYAEVAAKTLGYGTASATETATEALGITWLDPKWNPALSGGKAATGKLAAPMSLTAWRQHLITTKQYGWTKTATAQQMKLNVGQQLAQAFGLRKS